MNIALVLRRLGRSGGTEKYTFDLARWLAQRGHDVHVYCAELEVAESDLSGVTVHRLEGGGRGGVVGWLSVLAAASRVPRDRHDVVQGFGRTLGHDVYRAGGGVHAAWLQARRPSRLQRGLASLRPIDRLELYIDRRAQTSAKVLICNSEMAARQAGAWYRIPPRRVRVVRNGVDAERFRPRPDVRARLRRDWGVPDGGRVALFLGHGFRRKGLLTAGEAFAAAREPRDRFVVAGADAHQRRYLRTLRRQVGDALVVLGPVERPEEVLCAADATVLPTLYDAAANTTVEAMACGVPPVTSSADGNAEIVPDRMLVVHDPRDAEEVAAALRFAWDGGADLGLRCRGVAEAWPVSRNGEAMEAIYAELVHG